MQGYMVLSMLGMVGFVVGGEKDFVATEFEQYVNIPYVYPLVVVQLCTGEHISEAFHVLIPCMI
jgi:hypothetical protein